MAPSKSRWIVGAGAVAGPGRGARSIALALRAGWHETTRLAFEDTTVVGIATPGLASDSPRLARIVTLSAWALDDVLRGLEQAEAPVVLALPDALSDAHPLDPREVARSLADALGGRLDARRIVTVQQGKLGGPAALARALALLDERNTEAVIVGGADTLVTPEVLEHLVSRGRVVPVGWSGEPGRGRVIPSEGAAFIVLSKSNPSRALAELSHFGSRDASADGLPLVDELEAATSSLGSAWILSEVNGELDITEAVGESLREVAARRKTGAALEMRHDGLPSLLGDPGVASFFLGLAVGSASLAAGSVVEDACVVASGGGASPASVVVIGSAPAGPAAPLPGVDHETSAHRIARALEPIARSWSSQLAAIEHRLSSSHRSALRLAQEQLLEQARVVSESPVEEALLGRVDSLVRAAESSASAARAAAIGAKRRSKGPEPVLEVIARKAASAAHEIASSRSEVMASVAALDAGTQAPVERGFVTSSGAPALVVLPYAPESVNARSGAVLGVEQIEEQAEAERASDGDGDEIEEAIGDDDTGDGDTGNDAPEDNPGMARAASSTTELEPLMQGVETALEVIDSGWRTRTPARDVPWSPSLETIERDILAELDWLHALVRPIEQGGSYSGGHLVTTRLRAADSPLDPGRAFARTWVLACASDARLARAAASKTRGAPGPLQKAYEDALALR